MLQSTLTSNALQILEERYLLRDSNGIVNETPEAMFRRVAKYIAKTEKKKTKQWEEKFFHLMTSLQFLPNSPTLMNSGTPGGQLSACFVLPVEDSLEAIFTSLKNAALIHQSGGGTGYNFLKLRHKGDLISSSKGLSSGPIAFMKIYDTATEHVKQGGKRRGANMGILNVDHPDIEAFISGKMDGASLQNFNISVGITDTFMNAVVKDLPWILKAPASQQYVARISAKNTVLKTGTIKEVAGIPDKIKNIFKTSLEIPWKIHLLHQKAFQKFTDNSVSKTINIPAETSVSDISNIYMTAWKYGLKGITIYRDGSKQQQILQRCNVSIPEHC